MVADYLILAFGLGSIITAFLVISNNNPIHSVFYLVITFGNISAILIILDIEFIAIIFWIVYVGAIAILFVFVVKLIDVRYVEYLDNTYRYLPIGFIIGLLLFYELYIFMNKMVTNTITINETINNGYSQIIGITNPVNIGKVLYSDYYINLIIASLILLVAMIGAIVLTLSHEIGIKRQDIFDQVIRV